EDNEDDEGDGDGQRALDVVDGGADGGGAVEHRLEVDRRRDGGLQLREQNAHAVYGADDVRAGLAKKNEGDGGLAVDRPRTIDVLDGIPHVRHLGEDDGLAV